MFNTYDFIVYVNLIFVSSVSQQFKNLHSEIKTSGKKIIAMKSLWYIICGL